MPVTGLDHVQLAIPAGGEDKARHFFVETLGMVEVAKSPQLSPSGCWFEGGSASIHVGVDPDFRPAGKAHPALLVDDLAAVRGALERHGYAVAEDTPIEGCDRLFTRDGFGNRIELMQRRA